MSRYALKSLLASCASWVVDCSHSVPKCGVRCPTRGSELTGRNVRSTSRRTCTGATQSKYRPRSFLCGTTSNGATRLSCFVTTSIRLRCVPSRLSARTSVALRYCACATSCTLRISRGRTSPATHLRRIVSRYWTSSGPILTATQSSYRRCARIFEPR